MKSRSVAASKYDPEKKWLFRVLIAIASPTDAATQMERLASVDIPY
tara:strand:+ start:481 stop:618 length:138 start_codon:yes stop_codon:yes gene_type:complete